METIMESNSSQQSPKSDVRNVEVIGFGRRFLAIIIDGVFIFMVSLLIAFLLGILYVVLGWWTTASDWPWRAFGSIVLLLVSIVYYNGKWVQKSGQTFGKLMLGIRIVNSDGSPLTTKNMVLRYLGYLVSSLFASLGFIWVAIDKKRRGWHDIIAGTYVISIMHEYPTDGNVNIEASDAGRSWVWVVLWLLLVIGAEAGVISSLWFLGPVINNILRGLN